ALTVDFDCVAVEHAGNTSNRLTRLKSYYAGQLRGRRSRCRRRFKAWLWPYPPARWQQIEHHGHRRNKDQRVDCWPRITPKPPQWALTITVSRENFSDNAPPFQ